MEWNDLLAHRAQLREWLGAEQAEGEEAANWWLAVALLATGSIQSVVVQGDVPDDAALGTGVEAINIATEVGAVGHADRAVRLANLAGLIAGAGRTLKEPPELRPDVAARRCLDVLGAQVVREELVIGQDRPLAVGEMRELRRVKNLLTPLKHLLPYLTEDRLVDEVGEWLTVYPQLP